MKIYIDIDETIAYYPTNVIRKYENALPLYKNINKVNKLFQQGHTIFLWTARGTKTKIDHSELTKKQLVEWGVKYHYLVFGKPNYDLYIDDKSINSIIDWNDSNINLILSKKSNNFIINNDLFDQKSELDFFFNNFNEIKFNNIVNTIISFKNIFIIGVGKSGNLAKHTSDMLLSINISCINLCPINMLHGDFGIIKKNSLIILYSKSGNTQELLNLIDGIRKRKAKTLLITCNKNGKLINLVDHYFILPFNNELDSAFNIIPTTSIVIFTLFINLLITNIIKKLNIKIEDYKYNHVSGNIGTELFTFVKDVYIPIEKTCFLCNNSSVIDIIFKMTEKKTGYCVILETGTNYNFLGIITDGDIRRYITKNKDNFLNNDITDIINKTPYIINNLNQPLYKFNNISYSYIPIVINGKYIGMYIV